MESNKTCATKCPTGYPYSYGWECFDVCPTTVFTVENSYVCADKCEGDTPFTFTSLGNHCLSKCEYDGLSYVY